MFGWVRLVKREWTKGADGEVETLIHPTVQENTREYMAT